MGPTNLLETLTAISLASLVFMIGLAIFLHLPKAICDQQ